MALAPLQFSGRGLTPDVLGSIQQGQQVVQGQNVLEQQKLGLQQAQRAEAQQAQASDLARRAAAGERVQTGSELAQLMVDNPDLAQRVFDSAGAKSEFQKNELAQFGFALERADPAQQQQMIQQRVQTLLSQGRDPQDTAALLTATPERIGQFARTVQIAALNNPERLALTGRQQKAAELPAGQREFNALTAIVKSDPELKTQEGRAAAIELGLSPRAVGSASQTITELGTAKDVGDTEATIKQRAKFGELTGTSRANAIDKGFERIGKISTNISNLDRAIKAVEAGAGTGAIERRFPSIKAAAVELDQIQGELALDVIGAVTFGALSEGELNLAKQIALPTGLDGPQLIKHLQDRKAAQEKLRSYFQDQINFLDKGGSVAGFLREKTRQNQAAPEPAAAAQPATAQPAGAVQVGRFTVEAE